MADPIDLSALTEEGAYNLLVHRYEQVDMDGDGAVRVGEASLFFVFSPDADNGLKQAIVDSLKEMKAEGATSRELFTVSTMVMRALDTTFFQRLGLQTPAEEASLSGWERLQALYDRIHNPDAYNYTSPASQEAFDWFYRILSEKYEGPAEPETPQETPDEKGKADLARLLREVEGAAT